MNFSTVLIDGATNNQDTATASFGEANLDVQNIMGITHPLPVTEFITGVDLVKAQLLIASGERLENILPAKLEMRGHSIECRINAEHPQKFTPSAGKITAFNVPGGNGVRVDTAQYAEGVVPPYYDSLIAKLIVHGVDRAEAIAKMERALSQFVVQGIETSIPLHQGIFQDAGFRAGEFDTKFMERFLADKQ